MYLRFCPIRILMLVACAGIARPLWAGTDADGVVDYVPGTISSSALQQSGNAAIGLPASVDDGQTMPFAPPFHASAITIIGGGGHITLHFASPVLPSDGPDIGVFTNAGLVAQNTAGAITAATAANGSAAVFSSDAAIVSVSADGTLWFTLNGGNALDLTIPSNAFTDATLSTSGGVHAINGTNPADPFQPFTGHLSDFAGLTYPQMQTLFNGSFGGAWIDTAASGLDQINYIRFDVPTGDRLVLDAVTAATPEPGTMAIVGVAAAAMFLRRRKKVIKQTVHCLRRENPMKTISLLAVATIGVAAHSAGAAIINIGGHDYTTEFNAGSGSNSAMLILEYGPTTYSFGYSWNGGTPTGFDMLSALQAASTAPGNSPMILADQIYDFGDGPSAFIQSIDYKSNSFTYDYPNAWMGYFTSDGGQQLSEFDSGVSSRMLADGSIDDWVFQTSAAVAPDYLDPTTPTFVVAAPEPASLAICGIGALCLLKRRTRREPA